MTTPKASYPGIEIPNGWFSNDVKPFVDPEMNDPLDGIVSDLVLIDLDGDRKNFVTGTWHFDHAGREGWWRIEEFYKSSLDLDNMRWSYMPLKRYEK
jgi:hypothetical protein